MRYESAQPILSVLSHDRISSFTTCLPWGIFSSSSSWSYSCLSDLTILSRIIIPVRLHAAFWISAPLSGFLPITTYIGKFKLIQWPPCMYHLDMNKAAQIRSEEEKSCMWYSLKLVTNYSTSFHRWASWLVPSSHTSGWWLHWTCLHSILKRWLLMPVLKKSRAGLYFDWDTVDYRLIQERYLYTGIYSVNFPYVIAN